MFYSSSLIFLFSIYKLSTIYKRSSSSNLSTRDLNLSIVSIGHSQIISWCSSHKLWHHPRVYRIAIATDASYNIQQRADAAAARFFGGGGGGGSTRMQSGVDAAASIPYTVSHARDSSHCVNRRSIFESECGKRARESESQRVGFLAVDRGPSCVCVCVVPARRI